MRRFLQISVLSVVFWQIKSQDGDSVTCPENMGPFQSDENSTVICDCLDYHLYFPATDSCHEVYKRGPCPPENYLVLPPGEELAKCEKNPCLEDGLVLFEGSCVRLNEPCGEDATEKYVMADKIDFQIKCLKSTFGLFTRINAPVKECPKGSRRNALGICKRVFE